MPKPNSYTGEDCFEIQCHGGLSTSQALVEACSEIKGLRLAEAGEFSKRAIINGKLDLVQAEAINEIILSETERQRSLNLKQLKRGLSIPIKLWRNRIINILSKIEASLDFSDEDGVPANLDIRSEIKKIFNDIMIVLEKGKKYEVNNNRNKNNFYRPPNL